MKNIDKIIIAAVIISFMWACVCILKFRSFEKLETQWIKQNIRNTQQYTDPYP